MSSEAWLIAGKSTNRQYGIMNCWQAGNSLCTGFYALRMVIAGNMAM
jgi:hypothetical protein